MNLLVPIHHRQGLAIRRQIQTVATVGVPADLAKFFALRKGGNWPGAVCILLPGDR